ncbi:VOC family protein [Methylocystis heyeri]|uniref:VOC family protein n=1 Tax=Methylocystis heyeri TaxID=391905 RepID=A0A6B8KHE7_9HYPH|nr:VOC family protein [Methylocystis heyeri]QGM45890.1 VOC family protein [Methylocystis heyeri]
MFSHVFIGVTDFERSFAFYSAVLNELDLVLKFKVSEKPWAGWRGREAPRPLLLIGYPYNGEKAHPGNGQMIALSAPDRGAVDRCYAAAIANGGTCEGAPGLRPHYHQDYYGAYFRDPDGSKIAVCCHEPPRTR